MNHAIEALDWDTSFFALKTGRVSGTDDHSIRQALLQAKEEGYQLIYAYCEYPLSQDLLDEYTGRDVGGQVTFSKVISGASTTQESKHRVRHYEQREPTRALLELALLSGQQSRFFTDSSLPKGSYERMYERWLRNSLESKDTGAVFISGTPSDATGLITLSWDRDPCHIGLLAVSRSAQGRGIGSALLKAVEQAVGDRRRTEIHVRTQVINEPACRLYRSNGYQPAATYNLYHFRP